LGAAAEAAGLGDRVHFPGLVLNAAEPFGAIDLYWTINVRELTGIAGLEAAMFGLPVIAIQLDPTYPPAPDDWIPSCHEPSWLAESTSRLLGDRRARSALARAQQRYARANYSVEAMARAYVRLYEKALNREGNESAGRQR
jgi:glycosyltransferase involved in cell wall biosynthesis